MPYHIKRTSILTGSNVYYKAGSQWTDDYSQRKQYSSKSTADAVIAPTTRVIGGKVIDNTNGGFKNATVVTE